MYLVCLHACFSILIFRYFYYFYYFKQSIKIEDTYLKIFCQGFCKNLINDFVFVKHVRYFHEKCGVPRETILTNLYLGVRKY